MQDHTWQDKHDNIPFFTLTQKILGCCFQVMNALGAGFLESVYKNALVISMTDKGMRVVTDRSFEVLFEGRKVGIFIPDIIVDASVIIELKCCEYLLPEHQAQLINYLAVTNIEVGLLINFGKRKVEYKRAHHPAYPATCDLADPVPF